MTPSEPGEKHFSRRSSHLWLLVLFCGLIAITAHRVFTAALWGDELRTWRDGIEKPLRELLTWHHNPDHAPLGHLLARGGADVFGVQHAWSLRVGAWLCGLACVPALAWMGRTLAVDGRTRWLVGLLVAAMFVVDPTQTFQLTQARMYSVLLLSGTLAIGLAASILSRPRRPWLRTIMLGIVIGVGLWSHSQMYAVITATLLTTIGVTIARSRSTKRFNTSALPLFVAILIGLALAAPSIAKLLGPHNVLIDAEETPTAPLSQLEDAAKRLTGEGWITAVVVITTIGGVVSIARRRPAVAALLALIILCAVIDLLVAARFRSVGQARYLTITQPALWMAIASLVTALLTLAPQRATRIATAISIIALGGYQLSRSIELMTPYPIAEPFADAMRYVAAHRVAGSRVLVLPQQPFSVYSRYYDVRVDVSLRDDVARRLQPNRALRRATTRATTEPVGDAWIVGILTRDRKPKSAADDPLAVAESLGGVPAGTLEKETAFRGKELQRVVVMHVDNSGVRIADLSNDAP